MAVCESAGGTDCYIKTGASSPRGLVRTISKLASTHEATVIIFKMLLFGIEHF